MSSRYSSAVASSQAQQSRYDTERNDAQTRLTQVETEAERLRQESSRYREEAANAQLDRLRRGATTAGMPGSSSVDRLSAGLSSGRVNAGSRTPTVTQVQIDATDSVLNRRGPVVESLSRGIAPRPAATTATAGAAARSRVQSYYQRRFG